MAALKKLRKNLFLLGAASSAEAADLSQAVNGCATQNRDAEPVFPQGVRPYL
jgi:hypothetical protein